jgi:flagellar hook assembly protein FlgD
LKLEEKSFVEAGVYDLQGRRIRSLMSASVMEKGTYRLSWDATDGAGNAVPGGVYFYHILVDEVQYTGKMVLIR